jgi:ribonuclease G
MNEKKKIVINTNAFQTRVALIEKGELAEIFIEQTDQKNLIGNIYKGIVTRVLPGMNSAFIDIGLVRSAFLFGGDVLDPEEEPKLDINLEFFETQDEYTRIKANKKPIEKILREGQEIIVQISKEPLGSKGPRVTMHLALPGRYLVYMPKIFHIGVSRRIEEEDERERLKKIVLELSTHSNGIIVRTAAKDIHEDFLKQDLLFLKQMWQKIETHIFRSKAPSLLYTDLDIIKKTVRDLYDDSVGAIIIDDKESYSELYDFVRDVMPSALSNLEFYNNNQPIFDAHDIEMDIARAIGSRVELPSGGYLVIDQTEALTSFDINTGRFVGKTNARQTILKTNLEASKKVVEQLRMRNIGGIIIIDFIDMDYLEDREQVFSSFLEELKKDRAKNNVLKISELGLVQMTRKRTCDSLERQLMTSCPMCDGRGQVKSVVTESHDLLREIIRTSVQTGKKLIRVRVRTDVKDWVMHRLKEPLVAIKKDHNIDIIFDESRFAFSMLREPVFEVLVEE